MTDFKGTPSQGMEPPPPPAPGTPGLIDNAVGGMVLMGPHQVPGGGWIVLGLDPQGAAFAVVGPR